MPIEIAAGVAQRLVEHYSAAVLQVRTAETAAATRALDASIEQIWALGEGVELPHLDPDEPVSPKYISKVVPTPHGPMVTFDFGEDFPPELIERIPDLIVAALRTEGVTDGTVCCPREGGALTQLYWNSNASPPYPCGAGLRLAAPGRYELVHGEPELWLPDQPSRAQLQWSCRELLGYCFIADAIRNPDGPGLILPPVPR